MCRGAEHHTCVCGDNLKAADEFPEKTMAPNQLWQTDFTYLKVICRAGPATLISLLSTSSFPEAGLK